MNQNAKPLIYDRTRVKIGWWNQVGRSENCSCCGRVIKKTCNLRITAADGAVMWAEFGVVCASRIVEKYSMTV